MLKNYNIIMVYLSFSWDENKNKANQKKHGVSFEEAKTVFFDEDAIEYPDPDHSDDEDRFLMVGRSYQSRMLIVCHCHRWEELEIRIISARKLSKRELITFQGE